MGNIMLDIKMEIKKAILLHLLKSYMRDLMEKQCYTINSSGNTIGESLPGRVRVISIKRIANM